ncbi:MAG: NCS2 family permease [Planctomycetes bacterium]|nr:NCS2 family permease [Planctomycetota bacterium]
MSDAPGLLARWFRLRDRKTTLRTEVLAGATTFAAMAYIIVANPAILEHAGIPRGPSTVATVLTCVFGCLLMGLYANLPVAVAPYMGENAFIAFALVGIGWEKRLGSVFVAGAIFLVLTLLGLRTWLARAITPSMKHSFAAGIGLFLLFLGLWQTEIIVGSQPMPLKIGDLGETKVLLAIGGFVFMMALLYWRVPAAILLGMVLTGTLGFALGEGAVPERIAAAPWSDEYDLGRIAGHLDIAGVLDINFLPILLTLVLISFLDTLGTLLAVAAEGKLLDEDGNLPDMHQPMLVDSLSCVFGAVVGTSTSGAYIESATGIREGGRTGLTALTTAGLFLLALFFIPLFQPLQEMRYAYGPALIVVGFLMTAAFRKIDFDDVSEAVPAVATVALMVFTVNIANGLTAGMALHPILKVLTGRWRDVHLGGAILGVACLGYFAFGLPH